LYPPQNKKERTDLLPTLFITRNSPKMALKEFTFVIEGLGSTSPLLMDEPECIIQGRYLQSDHFQNIVPTS
jgi:hypothetical protein